MDSGEPKEVCIRWGPGPPCEGAIVRGKDMAGHAQRRFTVSCAKMAEPIFAVWVVDSSVPKPKEAQVQSYSPAGANVSSYEGTLAPAGNVPS